MKHITLVTLSSFALLFAACGGPAQDKATELAALKEQKSALEAQIAQVEKEVGPASGGQQRIRTVALTELKPETFRHYIDLQGRVDAEDNVLKNAPHCMVHAVVDEWKHSYTREQACFPAPWQREHKYWPTVGRVNDVYGDKNLVCSCPPVESYAS